MSLTRKPSDSRCHCFEFGVYVALCGFILVLFFIFYFRLDGDGTGRKSKYYILGFLRFVSTFSFLVS